MEDDLLDKIEKYCTLEKELRKLLPDKLNNNPMYSEYIKLKDFLEDRAFPGSEIVNIYNALEKELLEKEKDYEKELLEKEKDYEKELNKMKEKLKSIDALINKGDVIILSQIQEILKR